MRILREEKGAVLITMLILLIIITLIGTIAINVSTVEIQIAGNQKRVSMAFEGAEAGLDLAVPVIESTLLNSLLSPAAIPGAVYSADIESEILNDQTAAELIAFNPDITFNDFGQGVKVETDIDRMYSVALPGGSLEFASGYEGVGAGAAGGGTGVLYKINSRGTI